MSHDQPFLARAKNLHRWLAPFIVHRLRRGLSDRHAGHRHLLFALCDHYEPLWAGASPASARERVAAWSWRYPRTATAYVDSDGFHPRHTFFFPGEQYAPEYLSTLADLVSRDLAEVELHLHHDGDSAASLRERLQQYVRLYADHGLLSVDDNGRRRYGFIHGNWTLANSRADKRWCGVNSELEVLFDTGCYADFTFPSAPDVTQPRIVNQIYWPVGNLQRAAAHERAQPAQVGSHMDDRVLIVQGPLAVTRRDRGLGIRIDNGALTAADPATYRRLATWVEQGICVRGREEWVFVKVYCHGAPEPAAESLLGVGAQLLHSTLATHYNDGEHWSLHYVTAREMFNIASAAMAGEVGNPGGFRDYVLPPPARCRRQCASTTVRKNSEKSQARALR